MCRPVLDLPRDSRANQKIFLGEIDYETLVAQLPAGLRYHPLPEFDTVARDLALVADEETPLRHHHCRNEARLQAAGRCGAV